MITKEQFTDLALEVYRTQTIIQKLTICIMKLQMAIMIPRSSRPDEDLFVTLDDISTTVDALSEEVDASSAQLKKLLDDVGALK